MELETRVFDGVAGEMPELLSARDWSATPLGRTSTWSPVLRVMVSTMLRSGFPTVINWGPEMVALYNDAYIPLLGRKHPRAVGQSAKDTWPEAWEWMAPRIEQVLRGQTVRFENERQILERNGYPEECYFTFSQSPIIDVDGSVGGILTVATETTATVLAERRMRIAGELGGLSTTGTAPTAHTPDQEGTCGIAPTLGAALRILETARESVPFAVAFVDAHDGATVPAPRPVAHYGLVHHQFTGVHSPWVAQWTAAAERAITTGNVEVLTGLRARAPGVLQPGPLGPLHPDGAVMMPLRVTGHAQPVGAVLFGLTPYRILDEDYQTFLSMVASRLGTVLTHAVAHDSERGQLGALTEQNTAYTEFLQNVSYELRTPLTLLFAPLRDMLQSTDGQPAAHRDELQAAVRAVERLNLMVDALQDYPYSRAGARGTDRRLYRAAPELATQGRGIGLSPVTDLVRAPHGRVDLQSEPGVGTSVTVTVPLAASSLSSFEGPVSVEQADGAPAARGRVLLVEDDADLRRYLTRLLSRDGWVVTAVADAETALTAAVSESDMVPDLILTDEMLPGRSGLQLVSDVRLSPATCRLPVIVVAGPGGSDAAEEGLAAGADDYITKPFSAPELLARVRAHHELHQTREAAVHSAEAKAEHLRRGLDSNRVIGTAIGVIMATYRLSAEQAFRLLTTASQSTNRKVRDIAATVSETGALPYRRTDIDDLLIHTASAPRPGSPASSTAAVEPHRRAPVTRR